MYNAESKEMSFNFNSNINPQFKAQSAYKDASGMGGGGMYFKQENKKKKDEHDEDIFESQHKKDKDSDSLYDIELAEEDIPRDTMFNKFMNWFRPDD